MLRSSGPFANGSLSDKREFGRIHHVIMNQSQALLHWQNQTRTVGRSENPGGGDMGLFCLVYGLFWLINYSGVQISWQRVFWAENQGNHQNFDTSLLTYKCWLIFMAMKQKKNSKWPTQKRVIFHLRQFSIFFFKKSWIGPWVSRIDWCERHWCGSTCMAMRLSDISSKTA